MTRDPRWQLVWAEVGPWKAHPGWVRFFVQVAPDSFSQMTEWHQDDLAMDAHVFGGVLDQMIAELDELLSGDAETPGASHGARRWSME